MKKILTLKSWQVFILIWGIPLLTIFIPLEQMSNSVLSSGLIMIFSVTLFGWYYISGNELQKKLPENIIIRKKVFTFHISYMMTLIILIPLIASLNSDLLQNYSGVFALSVLYYFVSLFIVLRFTSKVLVSIELGKLASTSDYAGYLFLFFFSPIGIWIIQPKIRKIFL